MSTGGGPPRGAVPTDGEGTEDQAATGNQGPCLAGGLDSDVGLQKCPLCSFKFTSAGFIVQSCVRKFRKWLGLAPLDISH